MGYLKDEDHPVEATSYAAVVATMENKNKKDYSIPPSIEPPLTDPTKKRKNRNEGETTSDFNPLQSISKEAREVFHKWLSLQQGVVILKVKNSGTLNGCMMFLNKSMSSGDCGMFLIKYTECLMHDHPFSSLTDVRIDWFREKMAIELFYFKNLPM
eukprot:XP_019077943.1 PREDICTED: sentrin-specific protease 1-like [Vitis vinifera]